MAPTVATQRPGDWPRTGRVLPWMLAAFITMLWLTPFHAISLTASLPFDLFLDRIVLPFIVVAWVLTIAAGGREATRLRLTPIHVGVGLFVAIAFLSVTLNARELNHALLFDDSLKRLVLVSSYAAMFVVVASVVRLSEVKTFLVFTLILAVIAAFGIVYEYSFHYNIFYEWSRNLLPGIFMITTVDTNGVDEIGRRLTVGPAQLGLETVAMLAMALPIAIVGIMQSERRRNRYLYGLAMCVLIAAAMCTYRKSALIAPVVVILTIAYFRRRELLRLAPFAVVLIIVIHLLAPGALGGVVQQLHGSRLTTVNTTSHRFAGYEAVRPLVWNSVAFGQGFGSYDAFANHILDSQILTATIETGVLGVGAYIIMILSVVAAARPFIRSRDRERSSPALAAAAAAIALLTVSFLYDAMIFPHVPYIFLMMAAFMAVIWRHPPTQNEQLA
jgi:hypothetical protein